MTDVPRGGGWKREGEQRWSRPLHGLEQFMYSVAARGDPMYSMFVFTLAKLDEPVAASELSALLKEAWKKLYLEIPNISYSFGKDEAGKVLAVYDQSTSAEQMDAWLAESYQEKIISDSEKDPAKEVVKHACDRTTSLIPLHSPSRLFLDALFFATEQGSDLITHIGLVGVGHHTFFDGSGAWTCFDKLYAEMVNPTKHPKTKAAPESELISLMPEEVKKADRYRLGRQKIDLFKFSPGAHRMLPADGGDPSKVRMRSVRHRFTKEETARMLAEAKKRGVTISQLAHACHYLPLLKRYPAEPTEEICYATAVNLRPAMGLSSDYFSNAVTSIIESFPCSSLSRQVIEGQVSAEEHSKSLCNLANLFSTKIRAHISTIREEALSEMEVLERLIAMRSGMPPAQEQGRRPPSSFVSACTSDGILEKFVRDRYEGPSLPGIQVLDVYGVSAEPMGDLHGRNSTFDGRLALSFQYNEHTAWDPHDVDAALQEWIDALLLALGITQREEPVSTSSSKVSWVEKQAVL